MSQDDTSSPGSGEISLTLTPASCSASDDDDVKPINLHELIMNQAASVRRTYKSVISVPGPPISTPSVAKLKADKLSKIANEIKEAAIMVEKSIEQMSNAYSLPIPTSGTKAKLMSQCTRHNNGDSTNQNDQMSPTKAPLINHDYEIKYCYRMTKIASWRVSRSLRISSDVGRTYNKFIERLAYLVSQGKRKMKIHGDDNAAIGKIIIGDHRLVARVSKFCVHAPIQQIFIPNTKWLRIRRKQISVGGAVQILMGIDLGKLSDDASIQTAKMKPIAERETRRTEESNDDVYSD